MMELFPEPDVSKNEISNKNEEVYSKLLSNQISSESDKNLPTANEENSANEQIDHKSEALRGNFMPSIILLDEKKLDIDEPINEKGDTLLHLACKYVNTDVAKTLIENFEADINIKNKANKTPFYFLCKNKKNDDPFLFSYFIQKRRLNIDIEDCQGITPLICSIKSKNLNMFYTLISLGSDLKHKDKEFRDVYYYAIKYDNLNVLKYLLKHSGIDLFSSINNLTPILITSKGSRCCKYLFKYHYDKVINGISEPLDKANYPQEKLNLFNYELIVTSYKQNRMNCFKNCIEILKSDFTYKLYNMYFIFINYFIKKSFKNKTRKISLSYIIWLIVI